MEVKDIIVWRVDFSRKILELRFFAGCELLISRLEFFRPEEEDGQRTLVCLILY